MLSFIQTYWITAVVIIALALIVFLAVRRIVKDKKEGIGACGCKCSDCPHGAQCHH